jgi:hypothetical protein
MRCCTSTTMDWKTVHGRSKHEGLSFLTITLPDFGKDFERSLDQGHVDRSLFTGFQWKGGLPRFFGGFLDLVFDRSSGTLLNEPCVDAVLAIRQLTLMFGKISLPCSDARERKAMREFVKCEQDVRQSDNDRSPIDLETFCRVSDLLFARMFSRVDRDIYNGDIRPKHGPGKTADGLSGNQKYNQRTWTRRLEDIFSFGEFIFPSHSYYDMYEDVDILEPGSETPVRVVSVPKTLKTPRIIAIEPTAMQYAQQGILRSMLESIGSDDLLPRLIGFDNQEPNQLLARMGSLTGLLATLDLSEASDRVSNQLVRAMLRNHPYLHKAVDATRSRKADVQGHGVIRLAKFASMGSALTFPVEAMVFSTLIFIGLEQELNRPRCRRDVKQYAGQVRIYGDDIIVPIDTVRSVVRALEHFGAKVNTRKSFWTGRFRESCGKEYFMGEDVSIVRFRQEFPTHRKDATQIISMIAFRNQMYYAGYWATCKWLDEELRRIIKHYPVVASTSRVLGRESFLGYETQKMHPTLHSPLVKGYVIDARIPKNSLDGPGALLKYFLNKASQDTSSQKMRHLAEPDDKEHLRRSGRPHAVDIKLRNASPF